jgi:hypothetical protein
MGWPGFFCSASQFHPQKEGLIMNMTAEDRAMVDNIVHNAMATAAQVFVGMHTGKVSKEVGVKFLAVLQTEAVKLVIETCRANLNAKPSDN